MQQRLPPWFKQKILDAGAVSDIFQLLRELQLNTVCQSGRCPNIVQCFPHGCATFLILGNICTRNCTFCAVEKGIPYPLDTDEPSHIVEAVRRLGLNYVVITSVTRDDLTEGGASHFARTIKLIHRDLPAVKVEVLVPDFQGDLTAIQTVVDAKPEVLAHNLETAPRLYPAVRPLANYQRSLALLKKTREIDPKMITKSGMMLGLGETQDEVLTAMYDLRNAGCDLLTLGQYLAPSPAHHPIINFIPPDEFAMYKQAGLEMGFRAVASAPLQRSSFKAAELFSEVKG